MAPPSPPLCLFHFQRGHCRRGESCRFSHDAGGRSRVEVLRTIPCPHFNRGLGLCRFGDRCELSHGGPLSQEASDDADGDDVTSQLVCGICLESPIARRRDFGILPGCDHHVRFREWSVESEMRLLVHLIFGFFPFVPVLLLLPDGVAQRGLR